MLRAFQSQNAKSRNSLQDIILIHLTTGACALSSSEVCIKVASSFHSGTQSEENELYNQDSDSCIVQDCLHHQTVSFASPSCLEQY